MIELNQTSAEMAKYLKSLGFPQPEPAPGQAWYSLLDTPFFLYRTIGDKIGAMNLQSGICKPFDGAASEGMVYAPTIAEAHRWLNSKPSFFQGTTNGIEDIDEEPQDHDCEYLEDQRFAEQPTEYDP